MNSKLLLACFLLSSGAFACSAETTDASAEGQDQDLHASSGAALGHACGDDVAIHTKCASGLTCVLPTGGPISEHTAGVCTRVSKQHGPCGADVAVQAICAAGLTCVAPSSGPISEHTPGSCEKVSSQGGPCGDDVAIQTQCDVGLVCVFPSSGPISEHTPGVCHKASAN